MADHVWVTKQDRIINILGELMHLNVTKFLAIILFLFSAYGSCLVLAPCAAGAALDIGMPAPPLVLTTLDGSTFDLGKLHGKVVMVNYWATWCAPCRKEMPKLDAFYKKYHTQGLEIVGISIDFERDLEKARKVARTIAYPTGVAKSITDDGFGIPKAVPITWIVDTDGEVRDRFIEVRDELLNDIVVPLLPH